MLIPSGKPLYENVSSKEYYTKASELREKALDGCIRITFPDFEDVILFSGGRPSAAVRQSKRWLAVGDDLVGPAENKALSTDGRMAAYELPRAVLDIFIHMRVQSMVESELGPFMTAGQLIGYLEGDKSTCVLKLEDGGSTAYVFINFGKRAGAACESPEGRTYGDSAMNAMGRFKEHAQAAIYYMEPSAEYLRSRAEARVEGPADGKSLAALIAKALPQAPVSPFPAEVARPHEQEAQSPKQAMAMPMPGIKLVVAMSIDRNLGLAHRSRQQALEVFEEGNVAWVDGKTLASIRLAGPNASIVLPGGRECPVTLKEAPIEPQDSRYVILPRKLRSRLSVSEGSMVELKACP